MSQEALMELMRTTHGIVTMIEWKSAKDFDWKAACENESTVIIHVPNRWSNGVLQSFDVGYIEYSEEDEVPTFSRTDLEALPYYFEDAKDGAIVWPEDMGWKVLIGILDAPR